MESKKSRRADLERNKVLFAEIGMVVVLAAVLAAFNVRSYDNKAHEGLSRADRWQIPEEFIVPPTEVTPPEPPAEIETPMTDLKVIDNDQTPANEAMPMDYGDAFNRAVPEFVQVEVPVEEIDDEDVVQIAPEVEAEFPGGVAALMRFLADNIRYPQLAKDGGITGKVYITFVVEKDGSVSHVKVAREIGGGCGVEAVRVIKMMPKWTPGRQNGRPVRTSYTVPVNFELH
jgi:protein TonB